jgi:hypothetical protein
MATIKAVREEDEEEARKVRSWRRKGHAMIPAQLRR